MRQPVLIATRNPGKIEEIRAVLSQAGISVLTLDTLGIHLRVSEHGTTYAENAALKAEKYAQASGHITLADDSGLEVEALGGAPGLYSARLVPGPAATDADRRTFLLQQLAAFPPPWEARFYCAVAVKVPHHSIYFGAGVCEGVIIPTERGSNGFGYDPIFFIPPRNATMAELPLDIKNSISHRARALLAVLPVLKSLTEAPRGLSGL